MKRIFLLFTSLIFFYGWLEAQNEKISFNEMEHDFGIIGEKDGNASCDFIVTNNSKEPIVITKVTASCGCTTPIWTKEPIEKGKTGKISVSYNPVGRIGTFAKSITVSFDQIPPGHLKIKGEVIREKKKPEATYPVAFGDYLLKAKDLQFDRVTLKEEKTIHLEVFNNSDAAITQQVQKLPKYISVHFYPVIIPAKTAAVVEVSLNLQDNNLYGNLSGDITLLINNVRQSLPYSATVVDDFSQWTTAKKADAGKINVSLTEIKFDNFNAGNSKTLKLSNSGKSLLNVHAIQSSDPAVTVSKSRFSINPGEIVEVKVVADNKKIQSKLSSTLSIITDDPNFPVYVISVSGNKNL